MHKLLAFILKLAPAAMGAFALMLA